MLKIEDKVKNPTFVAGEVVELTEHPQLLVIVIFNESDDSDLFTGIMVSCHKDHHFSHQELPFLHTRWVKSAFQKSNKKVTFEN